MSILSELALRTPSLSSYVTRVAEGGQCRLQVTLVVNVDRCLFKCCVLLLTSLIPERKNIPEKDAAVRADLVVGDALRIQHLDQGRSAYAQQISGLLSSELLRLGRDRDCKSGRHRLDHLVHNVVDLNRDCLLYTSDAADDLLCVDLGGRRIIKKK